MAEGSVMSGHCFEVPWYMWSVAFGVSGMYAKRYMWSVVCRISDIGINWLMVCRVIGAKMSAM